MTEDKPPPQTEPRVSLVLYVLGLLCLDGDMTSGPVLNRGQLAEVGAAFARCFGDPRLHHGDDETYLKLRLSRSENELFFQDLLEAGMPDIVDEVQFGYYHHRAIFRFSFRTGASIHAVRDARARIHALIRSHCFDGLSGVVVGALPNQVRIGHVYSHCLLTVPDGKRVVDLERASLDEARFSSIYSVRSTTFGLYLPQGRLFLPPRRHYVRISVPSTVVYVDGPHMEPDLFDSLVDAIYYGGLYEKAKLDFHATDGKSPNNDWTNDLLLRVFNILTDTTSPNERDSIGVNATVIGLLVALVALAIALLSIVLS